MAVRMAQMRRTGRGHAVSALIVCLAALNREGACFVPKTGPFLAVRQQGKMEPASFLCAASAEPEGAGRKWAVVRQDEQPVVYDDARLAQADLEAESDLQFYRAGGPGGQHQARTPVLCPCGDCCSGGSDSWLGAGRTRSRPPCDSRTGLRVLLSRLLSTALSGKIGVCPILSFNHTNETACARQVLARTHANTRTHTRFRRQTALKRLKEKLAARNVKVAARIGTKAPPKAHRCARGRGESACESLSAPACTGQDTPACVLFARPSCPSCLPCAAVRERINNKKANAAKKSNRGNVRDY